MLFGTKGLFRNIVGMGVFGVLGIAGICGFGEVTS